MKCIRCKKQDAPKGVDGQYLCYGCKDQLDAIDYDKWKKDKQDVFYTEDAKGGLDE